MKVLNKQEKSVLKVMSEAKFNGSLNEVDKPLTLNGIFNPESVEFKFRSAHDKQNPNRPYLIFYGYIDELESFVNGDVFPYDIDKADLRDSPIDMVYIYEFDNEELKTLIDLGMFNPNFAFPAHKIEGKVLEVPTVTKCYYIDEQETDHVPVLILDVDTLSGSTISKESLATTNLLNVFDKVEREEELDVEIELDNVFNNEPEVEEEVVEEELEVAEPVIEVVVPHDSTMAMNMEEIERASISAIKTEQLGIEDSEELETVEDEDEIVSEGEIVTHTKNNTIASAQSHSSIINDEEPNFEM